MAEVTERHRTLAHQVYMMGDLHGRAELYKAIAQAIADAEERGQQGSSDVVYTSDPNANPNRETE
jgi:hypothetical protein